MDFDVQHHARVLALRIPAHERIGPFVCRFHPGWASPFANYAIPDDHAEPTAAEVRALIALFREHERRPRLEYLPSCAPAVEAVLLEAGFEEEDRPPLLACAPGGLVAPKPVDGLDLLEPRSDEDLFALSSVQHYAYEEPGQPDPNGVGGLRRIYENGGIAVLGRLGGEPAAGGTCSPPVDGLTELTGVAVAEGFRRRGVAAALSARLTEFAFERGLKTVWLEPSGKASERVYAGIGFRVVGEKLNISLPPGASER